jgi:hypothetical protein
MNSRSIKSLNFSLAFVILTGAALADDPPAAVPLTAEQAQARQFGILLGGTATEYDVCAGKGFLPKGAQSADETAKSYFEKMKTTNIGPSDAVYVQEGWAMMKKEVTEHESFYTQDKCTGVGKEWAKIMATMKKK